jgi:hypothetical protein
MGYLVVVKRDEPSLFRYLQAHFQEPDVRVLMDRRHGERRCGDQPVDSERRRADRRTVPVDEDPLWPFGFRVAVARGG